MSAELRRLRLGRNWTIEELHSKLSEQGVKVSSATVYAYERGRSAGGVDIPLSAIPVIADVFGYKRSGGWLPQPVGDSDWNRVRLTFARRGLIFTDSGGADSRPYDTQLDGDIGEGCVDAKPTSSSWNVYLVRPVGDDDYAEWVEAGRELIRNEYQERTGREPVFK